MNGDLLRLDDTIDHADVVAMHRVICCYPDWDALLRRATQLSRRVLAVSYPRNLWYVRGVMALENLRRRAFGHTFRTFVHSAVAMETVILSAGFERITRRQTPIWCVDVYARRDRVHQYVTKPFGILELMARVEAVLRRGGARLKAERVQFGDVTIDVATRTVRKRDQTIALTPMEFNLLVALVKRRGAVVSRLDLLHEVWGHASSVLTRTVDTHIAELRRKLEDDPAKPRHILTSRKAGYRLQQDEA